MPVKIADTRYGRQLYFDNDVYVAPLLTKYGEYNYGETDLFTQFLRSGDTAVDAGANIGCHTLALARFVGPTGMVLAFEPQRPVYDCLCGTCALNELWHVNTYLCALGDERGMTKVPFMRYTEPESFGGAAVGGLVGHDVPIVPLDDFDLPALHFVKIDVEGHEAHVLRGARETIHRHRPFLYVENDRKQNSVEVIETLLGYEYDLYLHVPPLFYPKNFNGCDENIFPGVGAIMLLGTPAEAKFSVSGLKPILEPGDMIEFAEDQTFKCQPEASRRTKP